MKKTEIQTQKYADWITTECLNPVDEITWLITTILESDNSHVVEEVLSYFGEE
jgi:hypothetical protein